MRILIAVDGSKIALRAVRHAARLSLALKEPAQLVLLHVDAPLPRQAALELGVRGLDKYHAENAAYATRAARAAMTKLGVAFESKLLVGDVAEQLVDHAKAGKFDLIVMGSHGRGALKSLFLGSVAIKVLTHTTIPVVIIR